MAPSSSKLLVVDASVLRAAGETEHPISSACRKALEDILRICHRAVVGPELRAEWAGHASRYARKWRVFMAARRKTLRVSPSTIPELREKISDRADLQKDAHLIEAALEADKIIVSLDDKAKIGFEGLNLRVRDMHNIRWINPVSQRIGDIVK